MKAASLRASRSATKMRSSRAPTTGSILPILLIALIAIGFPISTRAFQLPVSRYPSIAHCKQSHTAGRVGVGAGAVGVVSFRRTETTLLVPLPLLPVLRHRSIGCQTATGSRGNICAVQCHGKRSSDDENGRITSNAGTTDWLRQILPFAWLRIISSKLHLNIQDLSPCRRLRWGAMVSVALASSLLLNGSGGDNMVANAASAPVMALPKAEGRDPVTEALGVHERKQAAQTQQELNDMASTARSIEAQHGEPARMRYEREYKQAKIEQAALKQSAVVDLKRNLLSQGICPFTDLEGQRQVVALEKGVDLGKIPGTPFHLEKLWEAKSPSKSMLLTKKNNRRIVACMVQDMINRDVDPIDYFAKHTDQTEAILDMKPEQALRLMQQYEANLELYGQITVPKDGETSVKELLAQRAATPESKAARKKIDQVRAAKEKAAAKQKIQEEQQKARMEKAQLSAKVEAAAQAAKDKTAQLKQSESTSLAAAIASIESNDIDGIDRIEEIDGTTLLDATTSKVSMATSTFSNALTIQPRSFAAAGAAIVAVGGGAFAFKVYRDNSVAKEEERQRQFRLLMNGSSGSKTAAPLAVIDPGDIIADEYKNLSSRKSVSPPLPVAPVPVVVEPLKKKGLGIKNLLKKKSGRETDFMTLVASDADAPEFATTLAKVLSLGAPGRFPSILALPGGSIQLSGKGSMESLALDEMTDILVQAQTEASLNREQAAEVFANVVNCMLIQMVDLASSSLKEKEDKLTIDAINIVVDFMNHAASLYLAIADGVTIKPVTYGGDLSKSKLEQMFAVYASSSVLSMTSGGDGVADDFDSRVSLLQDVFQINEKKAEGLIMKAMQKNMMKMMKDGKGMEGMEEMMKGMGGMDGMGGLGGADGEGPSPEELKEMLSALKEMKDSGSIPPHEFDQVKKQFQEAFGASIDDVVKEADANKQDLSATDKELVQLMKAIMDD